MLLISTILCCYSEGEGLQSESSIFEIYRPLKGSQFNAGMGGSTAENNTFNSEVNLYINYKPDEGDIGWNFNTLFQYDYLSTSNGGVEKSRLYAQQNVYYMFNKYNGMFVQGSYLNDINNNYLYEWNENIGYQFQLLKTAQQNLIFSFGPGLQQLQLSYYTPIINQPTWLTQVNYNLTLSSYISVTEQLQNIASSGNTRTNSISTLTIQIYKNFGVGFNYQINYNSSTPTNKPGLTTISGISIVYLIN